jgi:hypothetical protein
LDESTKDPVAIIQASIDTLSTIPLIPRRVTVLPSSPQQQWDAKWCGSHIQIKSDNKVIEKIEYENFRGTLWGIAMGTLPNSSFKIKVAKKTTFYVGMAPREGIRLESQNHCTCGWYLWKSQDGSGKMYSQQGDSNGKEYVRRQTIKAESVIEVVLEEYVVGEDRKVIVKTGWKGAKRDRTKDTKTTVKKGSNMRRISFVIDGKNYGVAFYIPPTEVIGDLYPCAQLTGKFASIELV